MADERLTSLRSVLVDIGWNGTFLLINSLIVGLYFPPNLRGDNTTETNRCETNIMVYLFGQILLAAIYSTPQKPLQYFLDHHRPEWKRHPVVVTLWAIWSVMTLFDIAWFIAGQVWVFRSTECRVNNPPIFWLSITEIIFFYLSTIIPLTFYIILVFIARRRRGRMPPPPGSTGPAAHLRGGLSKVELQSLRTFLFKPTVDPVDEKSDVELGRIAEEVDLENSVEASGSSNKNGEKKEYEAKLHKEDAKPETSEAEPSNPAPDEEQKDITLNVPSAIPEIAITSTTPIPPDPTESQKASLSPAASPSIPGSPSSSSLAPNPPAKDTSSPSSEEPEKQNLPSQPLPPGASTTCAICFNDFEEGDVIRELACRHIFHTSCIDPWLIAPSDDPNTAGHRTCPLCVQEAILPEFRDPLVEQAMKEAAEEDALMATALERSRAEHEDIQRRREAREARRRAGSSSRSDSQRRSFIFRRSRRSQSEAPNAAAGVDIARSASSPGANASNGGMLSPPRQDQRRGRSFSGVSSLFRRSSNRSTSTSAPRASTSTATSDGVEQTTPSSPIPSPSLRPIPTVPETDDLTPAQIEAAALRATLESMKVRLEEAQTKLADLTQSQQNGFVSIKPADNDTSTDATSSLRLSADTMKAITQAIEAAKEDIAKGFTAEMEEHIKDLKTDLSELSESVAAIEGKMGETGTAVEEEVGKVEVTDIEVVGVSEKKDDDGGVDSAVLDAKAESL
ncbi:E3 ubiquitin-protein ligase rnf13 [Phlyctochytrium planicorne]|nr:E3 ubiquitin-protein ligase rnf13 [Phlyctochytrium planicorne]